MKIGTSSNAHQLFNDAVEAEEAGKSDEAARIYLDVIAAQPDFAPAYVNLGINIFSRDAMRPPRNSSGRPQKSIRIPAWLTSTTPTLLKSWAATMRRSAPTLTR